MEKCSEMPHHMKSLLPRMEEKASETPQFGKEDSLEGVKSLQQFVQKIPHGGTFFVHVGKRFRSFGGEDKDL